MPNESSLPLTGIKVVTVAFNLPGPAAVSQLVRYGAEVIKVEPPGGDPLARHSPDLYQELSQGQLAVRLDLKQPEDRQRLDQYLSAADLLVTSSLGSSLERLGLSWPALHAKFPMLCQVAIVGYPPPDDELTGHDLTYQASVGLLSPPAMPKTLLADMAGAQATVTAALAAILLRSRTGAGNFTQVPIAGALDFFTLPLRHGLTATGAHLGGGLPNYCLYQTAEGWLAVAALEPQFWAQLQALLNLKQGTHDELQAVLLTRSAAEWQAWAEQNRLPLAAVVDSNSK